MLKVAAPASKSALIATDHAGAADTRLRSRNHAIAHGVRVCRNGASIVVRTPPRLRRAAWRKCSAMPRVRNTRRVQHALRQHELQNAPKPQSSQRRCTQVRTLRHTKAWLNQTRAENCSRPQTCWAETGKSLKMQRNRNKKLTAGMWRLRSVRHTRARRDKRGSNTANTASSHGAANGPVPAMHKQHWSGAGGSSAVGSA